MIENIYDYWKLAGLLIQVDGAIFLFIMKIKSLKAYGANKPPLSDKKIKELDVFHEIAGFIIISMESSFK